MSSISPSLPLSPPPLSLSPSHFSLSHFSLSPSLHAHTQLTGTVSHVLGQATFDSSFQEERAQVQVQSYTHDTVIACYFTTPCYVVCTNLLLAVGMVPPTPQEQCQTTGDHLKAGFIGLSSGVFGGMTSIFTQPYRGARESGVGVRV